MTPPRPRCGGVASPDEPYEGLARRVGHEPGEALARLRAGLPVAGLPRAHVAGAASFFDDLSGSPRGARHVRVCHATACFAASAGAHVGEVEQALGVAAGERSSDGGTSLQPVHCLGFCYAAPAALDGDVPATGRDLAAQLAGRVPRRDPPIPVRSAVGEPVVLAGILGGEPAWRAWTETLAHGDQARVTEAAEAAGLRGRGGAGFLAARKWAALAAAPPGAPRYVVANGDEGDPGSYVDRLLMERDPHRVLEGLALAAFASGAREAFVFVRSEYPRARAVLRAAVLEARADGHLGRDIHGSGVDLDVTVVAGAGSYVAGEETSLLRALEGLRGSARVRPPFPTERGLLGRPTAVNNVETLAAVPWIVRHGAAAYHRHGVAGERGTKVVCLNERFARPGAIEVELGTPMRAIVEQLGGGVRDGGRLRAVQIGGPLGGWLAPDALDVPLASRPLRDAGAQLGHASIVAFDDLITGADVLLHLWTFAAQESCGACAPCRIGTRRGAEAAARSSPVSAALLQTLGDASLCAFGRGVAAAVASAARVYPETAEPRCD